MKMRCPSPLSCSSLTAGIKILTDAQDESRRKRPLIWMDTPFLGLAYLQSLNWSNRGSYV